MTLPPVPLPWRRPLQSAIWLARLLWGVASLIVLLTLLASTPLGSVFVLGYLFYSQEQVARSGLLRRALPGLPAFGRLGSLAVATALCLAPVWLISSAVKNAWLMAPQASAWPLVTALIVTSLLSAIYLILAVARGGSVDCFLCPVKNVRWLREQLNSGEYWQNANVALSQFATAIRPIHCLRLGFLGFVGTCLWLAIPIAVNAACRGGNRPWQRGLLLLGMMWLIAALAWLPILQIRLAITNRWSAMFDVRGARDLFRRSPFAWVLSIVALYAASIPLFLYSARVRLYAPIHDVWWDLALVSIACTFPARVMVAWSYHRAPVRDPSGTSWIWFCRIVLIGALAVYVRLLYLTPMTHEATPWQLEYHALTLPVPW